MTGSQLHIISCSDNSNKTTITNDQLAFVLESVWYLFISHWHFLVIEQNKKKKKKNWASLILEILTSGQLFLLFTKEENQNSLMPSWRKLQRLGDFCLFPHIKLCFMYYHHVLQNSPLVVQHIYSVKFFLLIFYFSFKWKHLWNWSCIIVFLLITSNPCNCTIE